MARTAQQFLAQWHKALEAKDVSLIGAMMADEVSLFPPRYHRAITDKKHILMVLAGIIQMLPDFTYDREWVNARNLALEFRGTFTDKEGKQFAVHGIDLIDLDENGDMTALAVMLRPLNSFLALTGEHDAELFEKLGRT